jgi:hypothetical protein
MNERIKALGRQASKLALDEYYARQKTEFVGDVIYSDIYDQKFAELIVKECVNIGDNYQDILGNEPECFNCRKVAYGIVDKIKQHFGVDQ